MPRHCFALLALLCACGSESPASPASSPESSAGGETGALDEDGDDLWLGFTLGVETILVLSEAFDEQERDESREADREAYGDDEDCEGVCGLDVPSLPSPEPLTSDWLDMFVEGITDMLALAEQRDGEHWTVFADRLRVVRGRMRVEGDTPELREEDVAASWGALAALTNSEAPGDELCWVAKQLLRGALIYTAAELSSRQDELELQLELSEDSETAHYEMDVFSAVSPAAETHRANAESMLSEGDRPVGDITVELEQFLSTIGTELRPSNIELLGERGGRLRVLCTP